MRAARSVVMTKWPDRPRSDVPAEFLGEDEFGAWYGSGRDETFTDSRGMVVPSIYVGAYHPERWWIPIFVHPDRRFEVYVHLATPPRLVEDRIETIDLELDVVRYPDGRVAVLDEDEFDEAIAEHAIPAEVVDATRRACDEVVGLLRAHAEPFDAVGARWFETFQR